MEDGAKSDEYRSRLGDVAGLVGDAVRRRRMLLLVIVAALSVIGVAAVSGMAPRYTATARIRLDPSRNPLAGSAQAQRAALTPEAIDTEVMAIRSPDLAQSIARAQRLSADPEFVAGPQPDVDAATVGSALLSHLTVDREAMAYVLQLRFTAGDPVKAARLANAFADGYVEQRTVTRVGTAERQNAWFQERLAELGGEADAAEARVAAYRASAGIVENSAGGSAGTINDQQVAPLASSLASAESEAAAARSTLAAARAQVARGGLDAVSEVLGSAVVADLRHQRAEVSRSQGEIDARYGPRHPESIRVANQMGVLDTQIEAESQRILGSLQATAAAAEARVASLRGSLGRLEHERERNTRDAVLAGGLEREAAAKRALYDQTAQMARDSIQAARLPIAQAEVIERAVPPAAPTSPDKPLLYVLCVIGAMTAGVATVVAMEMAGGGFRSVKHAEDQLGVPVLAVVPTVRKGERPADVMLDRPASMFAESLRIARAAVLGPREDAAPRVIAITSPLPGEGKTTVALALARTLAIGGARTLLIECDIRRAVLRGLVHTGAGGPGLLEVLRGEADAGEAVLAGDVANLDQLLVRSPFFKAEDPFGEGRMERLLTELRRRYTHIVIDLPPLMGLADGRPLAALADATALVVRWNDTPVPAAVSALSWLRSDGSNPVGVILTQVDPSAPAIGGLYHFSNRYSDYYQAA